jgi:hypothetical protein
LIAGKARHGKDQTALFLKEKLQQKGNKVLIAHYGDLVKFICEKYFDWNGEKDEKGRSLLQWIGTDVVREINPNYWVDFIVSVLSMFENEWDYVLIPDVRFKNELNWDENWNTISLRVNRLNFESELTLEQKNHPSETDLDNAYFDYEIYSDSGLDKLEIEVDKFIDWLEEMDE